jgi:hypothetical protein
MILKICENLQLNKYGFSKFSFSRKLVKLKILTYVMDSKKYVQSFLILCMNLNRDSERLEKGI